jgi:hypothetical protein
MQPGVVVCTRGHSACPDAPSCRPLATPKTATQLTQQVRKWYFNKRDPVEVLEADPDLVRRAQVR